jgi:hypothetical protein
MAEDIDLSGDSGSPELQYKDPQQMLGALLNGERSDLYNPEEILQISLTKYADLGEAFVDALKTAANVLGRNLACLLQIERQGLRLSEDQLSDLIEPFLRRERVQFSGLNGGQFIDFLIKNANDGIVRQMQFSFLLALNGNELGVPLGASIEIILLNKIASNLNNQKNSTSQGFEGEDSSNEDFYLEVLGEIQDILSVRHPADQELIVQNILRVANNTSHYLALLKGDPERFLDTKLKPLVSLFINCFKSSQEGFDVEGRQTCTRAELIAKVNKSAKPFEEIFLFIAPHLAQESAGQNINSVKDVIAHLVNAILGQEDEVQSSKVSVERVLKNSQLLSWGTPVGDC